MTILPTIDRMNKNQLATQTDPSSQLTNTQSVKMNDSNRILGGKQLYFVNLDNYLHQQFNTKVSHLNQFYNPHLKTSIKQQQNHKQDNRQINNQQVYFSKQDALSDQNLNKSQSPTEFVDSRLVASNIDDDQLAGPSSTGRCFTCFDKITNFIDRRLNRQPIYNLIKSFIVLLTIVQFCIFLMAVLTYEKNEQAHFYPKHGQYFFLGTNLANLNALLSTIFYLYSIIGEIWPLLSLMTTLQAFYTIIELLALLIEPLKLQYIYIMFIMLTSMQTFGMLLFVVMLRIKKLQERKLIYSYV